MFLFSGSVLGKLIGFAREVLMAAIFGTSSYISAYRIAQAGTIIPIDAFLSKNLEVSFLPLYIRYAKNDDKKAKALFAGLFFLSMILAAVIFLLLYLGSSLWVSILAPGMDPETKVLTESMLRVTSIAVPLYVLGSLLARLEMAYDKYAMASLRSTIQSLGLIAGTLFAFYFKNAIFLGWGFTWAYGAYALIGLLRLRGFLAVRPCDISWRLIKETLLCFWHTIKHIIFLPFLIQTNTAIERIVASLISIRVIAALDYAKFISESGIALLASPLGMAGIAKFSAQDLTESTRKIAEIMGLLLTFMIPISIFIMYYHSSIIQIIYTRGAFDNTSAYLTGQILFGISFGLWADVLSYFLIRILSAQLRNKEVLLYTVMALALDIVTKITLYKALGSFVLGLGYSIRSIILCLLVINAFNLNREFFSYFWKLFIGSIIYILICFLVTMNLNNMTRIYFLCSILMFLIYWIAYLVLIPSLRRQIIPLIIKFKNLFRK